PFEIPVEVIAVKPAGTKVGVQIFAISHRGCRRVAMIFVVSFVRDFFTRDFLPNQFTAAPVITNYHKLIRLGRRFGARRSTFLSGTSIGLLSHCGSHYRVSGLLNRRYGCQDEYRVPPNNRGGTAGTRHVGFPADVAAFTPSDWWVGQRSRSSSLWSAPLRPEF